MKFEDLLEETYFSLAANKVRSGLTMLGIVIGIGSVIAMVSIGQGAKASVESRIESIGSNLIMVMPGMQRSGGVSGGRGSAQSLTIGDAEALREINYVSAVAPESSKRYQVTAKGTNTNTSVVGTTYDYQETRSISMAEGSFISSQNVKSISKVAVLGSTARDDLFGEGESAVGKAIKINKIDFKVVGVTESKGGSGFGSQDDMIFIPVTTMSRFLSGNEYLSTIDIQVESQKGMSAVEEEVASVLLDRHNISSIDSADFSIMNQSDIVETASSVTDTFTLLLGAIAGISLIVGGIGIMNMMLTTVTERTREIGLRKAIGAKRKDISSQFLVESVVLTFVGGVVGVGLGFLASLLITKFGGITTTVSLTSILLAFGVSAVIGILFGYYPAVRASKLNPIEALRYE